MEHQTNNLKFKRLGINTQHEHIAYMREDCHVCKSEGFEALTRILVSNGNLVLFIWLTPIILVAGVLDLRTEQLITGEDSVIIYLSSSYLIMLSLTLKLDNIDCLIGDLRFISTWDEINDIWVWRFVNFEANISVPFDLLITLSVKESFLDEDIMGLLNLI